MTTFRIESTSRWDALALAARLAGYRWYLVEPARYRWDVCIPVTHPGPALPEDLRSTITAWLRERELPKTMVRTPTDTYFVAAEERADGR